MPELHLPNLDAGWRSQPGMTDLYIWLHDGPQQPLTLLLPPLSLACLARIYSCHCSKLSARLSESCVPRPELLVRALVPFLVTIKVPSNPCRGCTAHWDSGMSPTWSCYALSPSADQTKALGQWFSTFLVLRPFNIQSSCCGDLQP